MKKTTFLRLFFLVFWLTTVCTIKAQTQLGSLVGQLNSAQRASYFSNLDSLTKKFNLDSLKLDLAVDSLNRAIFGRNPLLGINDSVGGFRIAIDSFFRLFRPTDSLGMRDRDTILGEYGRLKDASLPFTDSLGGLFGIFRDSLFSNGGIPLAEYPLNDTLWDHGRDSLNLVFRNLDSIVKPKGLGNFAPVLNLLFNKDNYKLELFTGIQNADVAYFALRQKLQLPVIGLRTVEQFNKLWEQHWQMQASWNVNDVNATLDGEKVFVSQEVLSPELLQMEFSMMFNPVLSIFSNSNRSVRLISSLGIEVGTYAPAHKNYPGARDLENKGFTTGFGPQIGAGFSINIGPVTAFSLGTMTFGDVICQGNNYREYNISTYKFFSTCVSAGVRYGDKFTLRYENRSSDWYNNIKGDVNSVKNARTSQITVGIPLSSLSRTVHIN